MLFIALLDVPRLLPDGAYGVGNYRLHEWNLECQLQHQGDRFRRWNGRPYDFRMELH